MANHFSLTERKGKKCILVSTSLCTPQELELVKAYIAQGYIAVERKARKSSGKGITKNDIIKKATEKKHIEAYSNILTMIDNKEKFMSVLSAFKKAEKDNPEKKEEKKAETK